MPCHRKPLSEVGVVAQAGGSYVAHAVYRDGNGTQKNIRGPYRDDKARAEADLAAMRAAGAVAENREQGLLYMAAEARRRQDSAKYEAEIRTALTGGAGLRATQDPVA